MVPTVAAPSVDGKGKFFASFAQEVGLRPHVANSDATRRASVLVLQKDPAAKDVCPAVDGDQLLQWTAINKRRI